MLFGVQPFVAFPDPECFPLGADRQVVSLRFLRMIRVP